jgi:hypothetical protein
MLVMLGIDQSYHIFIGEILRTVEETYPTFITDAIQGVPVSDPNRLSMFLTMLTSVGERTHA